MANRHYYVSLDKLARFLNKLKSEKTFIQKVISGSKNGTIAVDGTNVPVTGLGSAAYTNSTDYATAAQGAKADTAVQPSSLNSLSDQLDNYVSWYTYTEN